ncbi:MAG: endonuclease III [Deltaproteobacteria bacterium]|nr:endonuclease III [Deltaproteobacteria bacterium]
MRSKQPATRDQKRALEIVRVLKRAYPGAKCSLDYSTPYQLLVSTILSAQCTDERVNKVTPALFRRFPDARAMAKADLEAIEQLVKTTGFYKSKALSLSESARAIAERHGGEVPRDLEALVKLRGVGRKTANVVLGNAFGKPEGVVVDTHVGRLSRRLGLTKQTDPVKVEHELAAIVPKKEWTMFSHLLIHHGRARCMARNPDCVGCEISELCPKIGVMLKTRPRKIAYDELKSEPWKGK